MKSHTPLAIIAFTLVIFLYGKHSLQQSFTLEAGASSSPAPSQHGLAAYGPNANALRMHRESLFVLLPAVPLVSLNAMELVRSHPASLVEFTPSGDGGKDYYDIGLVDGFNLPISITPLRRFTAAILRAAQLT
ncbi:hypothetical protein OIU79_028034 [Salix purpurea]|uniref:Uncharacterized protein n=1 Tax=Salix purpurea TaxID=77065 RepID=A0A9Q0VXK4_SALPP|nr:hypothetical protein OIU79_028034 [Salix purpurea]